MLLEKGETTLLLLIFFGVPVFFTDIEAVNNKAEMTNIEIIRIFFVFIRVNFTR